MTKEKEKRTNKEKPKNIPIIPGFIPISLDEIVREAQNISNAYFPNMNSIYIGNLGMSLSEAGLIPHVLYISMEPVNSDVYRGSIALNIFINDSNASIGNEKNFALFCSDFFTFLINKTGYGNLTNENLKKNFEYIIEDVIQSNITKLNNHKKLHNNDKDSRASFVKLNVEYMFHPGLMLISIGSNLNMAEESAEYSISEMSKGGIEIKRGSLLANIYEQLDCRLHPLYDHVIFDDGKKKKIKPTKKQRIESLREYLNLCLKFSEQMGANRDYESAFYALNAFYDVSNKFLKNESITATLDKDTMHVVENINEDVFALAYCYATMDSIKKEGRDIPKNINDYRRDIARRIGNNLNMLDIIIAEESAKHLNMLYSHLQGTEFNFPMPLQMDKKPVGRNSIK